MALFSNETNGKPCSKPTVPEENGGDFFLSWRLAVEANNVRAFRTVPALCLPYIETYMTGGQYDRDVELIVDQILSYVNGIDLFDDGMDAWVLDVDETCLSHRLYYKGENYGGKPYDQVGFRAWVMTGGCPAIPAMLELFNKLVKSGFKVFLVTARDKAIVGQVTIENLHNQGFVGYEGLILRTTANKGQSAGEYKSSIRKQLVEEGYTIWGNTGDQWSDFQGDCAGNRTFKLPNPMYFVA